MLTFFCQITAYILRNTRRVHTQNKLILLTALSTGQLLSYFLNLFFSFEFQQLLQLLTLTNVLNIPVSMNRLTFLAHSGVSVTSWKCVENPHFCFPDDFCRRCHFPATGKRPHWLRHSNESVAVVFSVFCLSSIRKPSRSEGKCARKISRRRGENSGCSAKLLTVVRAGWKKNSARQNWNCRKCKRGKVSTSVRKSANNFMRFPEENGEN